MTGITFRPFRQTDLLACMRIFDANCPEFFAPNERADYERFLAECPEGYEVCEIDGRVIGVFGVLGDDKTEKRLNWIMVDPDTHGMGVGAKIMERAIQLARSAGALTMGIATSQIAAPFFEKYGATTLATTKDGHGPGMDLVDMVLPL